MSRLWKRFWVEMYFLISMNGRLYAMDDKLMTDSPTITDPGKWWANLGYKLGLTKLGHKYIEEEPIEAPATPKGDET